MTRLLTFSLLTFKRNAVNSVSLRFGRTATAQSMQRAAFSVTAATSSEDADILKRLQKLIEESTTPKFDATFDAMIQSFFPGAIDNSTLEKTVVRILAQKGYDSTNTLLATSLCCDELARRLEDDFVKIYGNNFNLGGLAGFPFAGNTGYGAMAAHVPDQGYCFMIFGPHVGVTADGVVGHVERRGIELVDLCCGSAVTASNYLKGITDGGAKMTTNIQNFADFQQGAVQELILPHGKRLSNAKNRMVELPYALYDSQDLLVGDIIKTGSNKIKKGLALLGGIQINTGPKTLDYFHPLRFDYITSQGQMVEDLLPALLVPERQRASGDPEWNASF